MNKALHFDILIAGGGMAGLSQALCLAGLGLRIALVDNQGAPPASSRYAAERGKPDFDTRVSALTPASRLLFERLKVWPVLESLRVCPYQHMTVWDADGTGHIDFDAGELHLDDLGHIVENRLVTCVLAEAASQIKDLHLIYQDSVESAADTGKIIEITLKSGQILTCSLLIGADGGNSQVRRLAGFSTREWSYQQSALVCTVRTERAHGFTAWQRFQPTGPLAFLPLYLPDAAEQHYCSIVWSSDPPQAEELVSLSPESLALRLAAGLEHRLGRVELCSGTSVFPLRQRHAADYVKPRIALVGDAAHTIHPLAGQGINLRTIGLGPGAPGQLNCRLGIPEIS